MSIKKLKGYYPTGATWLPIKVDSNGKVVISNVPTFGVLCRAYLSADQEGIAGGGAGYYKINLDTKSFDIGSNFNIAGNCFIVPVTGYYLINGIVGFAPPKVSANTQYGAAIYVDPLGAGAPDIRSDGIWLHCDDASKKIQVGVTDILYLIATDKLYLYCYTDDTNVDIAPGDYSTYMSIMRVA